MNDKNGRIWPAIQAGLLAAMVGVAVWYVAARCDAVSNDVSAFARVSELWAGVLDTGVMLTASALLTMMLSRIDYAFGLKWTLGKRQERRNR